MKDKADAEMAKTRAEILLKSAHAERDLMSKRYQRMKAVIERFKENEKFAKQIQKELDKVDQQKDNVIMSHEAVLNQVINQVSQEARSDIDSTLNKKKAFDKFSKKSRQKLDLVKKAKEALNIADIMI